MTTLLLTPNQVRQIVALRRISGLPEPHQQTREEYLASLEARARAYIGFLKMKIAAYESAKLQNFTPGLEQLSWTENVGVNEIVLKFMKQRLAKTSAHGMDDHESYVRHALADREDVPDCVLEQYPELTVQYERLEKVA